MPGRLRYSASTPPDTTTLEEILVGSAYESTLGSSDDSAAIAFAFGRLRARAPKLGAQTVDFHDTLYFAETTPVIFATPDLTLLGPGGFKQALPDGPYAAGSRQARTRAGLRVKQSPRNAIVGGWELDGPNNSFAYNVDREGQAAIWNEGSADLYLEDVVLHHTFGDALYHGLSSSKDTGGTGTNDVYPSTEWYGGYAHQIGRCFHAAWATRASDAIDPGSEQSNPGDPATNDAPSASGLKKGLYWHGDAAHPFVGDDCKRSLIDLEPISGYRHLNDIDIGASDGDRTKFLFSGVGLNTISAANGWALINRLRYHHVKRIGAPNIRIVASPLGTATNNPRRSKYTMDTVSIDHNEWTLEPTGGDFIALRRVANASVLVNIARYRDPQGPIPFDPDDVYDCPGFDKGGASQFGNNTFTPG
jgi:hypothetical protein